MRHATWGQVSSSSSLETSQKPKTFTTTTTTKNLPCLFLHCRLRQKCSMSCMESLAAVPQMATENEVDASPYWKSGIQWKSSSENTHRKSHSADSLRNHVITRQYFLFDCPHRKTNIWFSSANSKLKGLINKSVSTYISDGWYCATNVFERKQHYFEQHVLLQPNITFLSFKTLKNKQKQEQSQVCQNVKYQFDTITVDQCWRCLLSKARKSRDLKSTICILNSWS